MPLSSRERPAITEQGKDEEENKVGDACDLIALATRQRSDIERWTRGCVTDRVLGYTRLPLLIVRRHEQSVPVISEQVQTVHGSSG